VETCKKEINQELWHVPTIQNMNLFIQNEKMKKQLTCKTTLNLANAKILSLSDNSMALINDIVLGGVPVVLLEHLIHMFPWLL
jgi:hypothetical protein